MVAGVMNPAVSDQTMHQITRLIASLFFAAAIAAPTAIRAGPRPQDASAQFVLARERLAPAITTHRAVSIPLLTASFRLHPDPATAPVQFSHQFRGANQPFPSIGSLAPMDEFRTVYFTQSSVSLVQVWRGRLQLDAFQSTLHVQSVQLSPSGPHAIHLSGISLGFHFGRDAGTGRASHAWRRLSRIVDTALN